ncbi:MAG: hypothetical protein ACYDH6_09255 [Acidimicrobiales bacterium]
MTTELAAHSTAVRDAVLEGLPDEPLVSHASLGRIRGELKKRVEPFAAAPGEIYVDRHVLAKALICPASAARDTFEWSAPLAARSLGLPALSSLYRSLGQDVLEAVGGSVAEAIGDGLRLGEWLASLDATGLAATVASAASWAARAWVAVPWPEFDNVLFGIKGVWHRPAGFDTPVVLQGRPDANVMVRRRRATDRVLVDVARFDEGVARLDALIAALSAGRAPLRIVFVHPASGTVTARDVDVAMLDRAVEDIASVVSALAPTARGEAAAEVPGAQCWSCDHRDDCATGTAWMAAQPRRIAGIPAPLS